MKTASFLACAAFALGSVSCAKTVYEEVPVPIKVKSSPSPRPVTDRPPAANAPGGPAGYSY